MLRARLSRRVGAGLGVPRHTFYAMFGAVIAQGRDYRETFQEFRPEFDLYKEREKRAAAGHPESFGEADLYEDVRPSLTQLRGDGLWLGIAGNQTVRAGQILRELFSRDVDPWPAPATCPPSRRCCSTFERACAPLP